MDQESFPSNDLDQRVLIFVYQWLVIFKSNISNKVSVSLTVSLTGILVLY